VKRGVVRLAVDDYLRLAESGRLNLSCLRCNHREARARREQNSTVGQGEDEKRGA